MPKGDGGLGLPSPTTLWKKQQVSGACQLISSQDPVVRHVATHLTTKEERKTRVKLKPMMVARDALVTVRGMGWRKLCRVARNMVADDNTDDKLTAMISSEGCSRALRTVENEAAAEWASARSISHLPNSDLPSIPAMTPCPTMPTWLYGEAILVSAGYVERPRHCYMCCAAAPWLSSLNGLTPTKMRCPPLTP